MALVKIINLVLVEIHSPVSAMTCVKHPRTLFLMLATALSCCQGNPRAYEFSTSKPSQSVVGKYLLTDYTLLFLKENHYNPRPSFVELRSDSTLVFENIPDIWNAFKEPNGGFDSGSGRWSIHEAQDWWEVKLEVDTIRGFSFPGVHDKRFRRGFDSAAELIGKHQPYKLNFTIGDPDTGEALQYVQQ